MFFHNLTKKLFCVAPSATELDYPYNFHREKFFSSNTASITVMQKGIEASYKFGNI